MTDQPDEDMFTPAPDCATCHMPHRAGRQLEKLELGWQVMLWHLQPCPRAWEAPAVFLVPGCATCHSWPDSDLQWTHLEGRGWSASPMHAAACPQLEPDAIRQVQAMLAASRPAAADGE